jgi:hypothetical protein
MSPIFALIVHRPTGKQAADRAAHVANRPAQITAERFPIGRAHSSLVRGGGQGEAITCYALLGKHHLVIR